MKRTSSFLLSILTAVTMTISAIPVQVFAEPEEQDSASESEIPAEIQDDSAESEIQDDSAESEFSAESRDPGSGSELPEEEDSVVTTAAANKSISTAEEIQLNTTYTCQLPSNGTNAWYQFTVPEKCELNIDVGIEEGKWLLGVLNWYIYDTDKDIVYAYLVWDDMEQDPPLLSAGTYYLCFSIDEGYWMDPEIDYENVEFPVFTFTLNPQETEDPCEYTITYDANGGTGAPAPQTAYADHYTTLATEIPEKGYTITYDANGGTCQVSNGTAACTFKGWVQNFSQYAYVYKSGGKYQMNMDTTLYASWTSATFGELPTPTRDNAVFEGWYTDPEGGTKIASDTELSEDTTIYAHWTDAPIIISQQPENVSARVGDIAAFQVRVDEDVTYQWFYSNDCKTWYKSSAAGYNTDTLSVKVKKETAQRYYKCKITDAEGNSVFTHLVQVDLIPSLSIISQPESVSTYVNKTVTFHVEGENASAYQWFFSADNGKHWYKSGSTGNTTDTLTLKATEANAARLYKCKLTDSSANSLLSDIVQITLLPSAEITSQPEDISAELGQTVSFHVTGENISAYQWYFSADNGQHWYKSGMTGNTTDTLKFVLSETNARRIYKCKLTDDGGNCVWTDTVKVNLFESVRIISQPQSVEGQVGDRKSFTVEAENVGTYQWYFSPDNGKNWYKSGSAGSTTDTLTITIKESTINRLYKCKLIGYGGKVVFTDVVS